VTQRNPDYGDAWSALGYLYLWWSKPIKAVDALSFCINLIPDNPELFISRAKAHLSSNQLQLAKDDLEKAKLYGGIEDVIDPLSLFVQEKIESNEAAKTLKFLEEANVQFSQSRYDSALTLYLKIIRK